jgi:hypothetical protein
VTGRGLLLEPADSAYKTRKSRVLLRSQPVVLRRALIIVPQSRRGSSLSDFLVSSSLVGCPRCTEKLMWSLISREPREEKPGEGAGTRGCTGVVWIYQEGKRPCQCVSAAMTCIRAPPSLVKCTSKCACVCTCDYNSNRHRQHMLLRNYGDTCARDWGFRYRTVVKHADREREKQIETARQRG